MHKYIPKYFYQIFANKKSHFFNNQKFTRDF